MKAEVPASFRIFLAQPDIDSRARAFPLKLGTHFIRGNSKQAHSKHQDRENGKNFDINIP